MPNVQHYVMHTYIYRTSHTFQSRCNWCLSNRAMRSLIRASIVCRWRSSPYIFYNKINAKSWYSICLGITKWMRGEYQPRIAGNWWYKGRDSPCTTYPLKSTEFFMSFIRISSTFSWVPKKKRGCASIYIYWQWHTYLYTTWRTWS